MLQGENDVNKKAGKVFAGGASTIHTSIAITMTGTRIKAVLSDDEGMWEKAYRNPACIMPGCTGEDH